MSTALEYEPRQPPRFPRVSLGILAAAVGSASGIWITYLSYSLAQSALIALTKWTDCGTGRHDDEMLLMLYVPWLLGLPAAAWILSCVAGYAQLICRCAFWLALAGWGSSTLFVELREFF